MKRVALVLIICMILTGCTNDQPRIEPEKQTLVQADAYTLSDGTQVDRWEVGDLFRTVYKTPKGWELLQVEETIDIADVIAAGMEGFQHLNETAQGEIRTYYEENWPELDVRELLENAWQDMNDPNPEKGQFSSHYAYQAVYSTACNENIMCFTVETGVVGSDNVLSVDYFSTIFDRDTGEVIEIWDLFNVSKTDAKDAIAWALAQNDAQYEEVRAALDAGAKVRLEQGGLEVFFPLGTISWYEYPGYMTLECEDLDIWQDWAITEKRK